MDCIYNRKDIEEYLEVMIRIQTRLKNWKSFTVQQLYNMILDVSQEKVKQIRRGIIDEMKQCGLIRTMQVDRVQSLDDYQLITSCGYSGRQYFGNSQSLGYYG